MGNDGGSIPKRRELVKEAARLPTASQLKESALEQQSYLWTTDPITRLPLSTPIVSDHLGRLFNKDSIIEQLLSSSPSPLLSLTVSSLKDVVELHFLPSPEGKGFICPVTRSPLGPGNKAVYSAVCGHVVSAVAERETSAAGTCSVCDIPREESDVIPVLPVGKEEIARLQTRIKRLREEGRTHSLKKAKGEKKKNKKRKHDDDGEEVVKKLAVEKGEEGGINNAGTKALTEKVLREQERKKAERKANENLKSLFSSRDQSKPIGRSSDFMTRGYQIPADAKR